jgi:hypothetical protein
MTHKERIFACLAGKPADRIPYAPRLDLWYAANKRAGTLPQKYRNASLIEITRDLDVGYHGIIPRYKDMHSPDEGIHNPLGIFNHWSMPIKTVLRNVKFSVETKCDETIVEYTTAVGKIRTAALYDENMKKAGISVSHISEFAVKSHEDYKAVACLFRNAEVVPNYAGYNEFAGMVGQDGLAAGKMSVGGSPLHFMLHELMPLELFFFELADHPDELLECAAAIGGYIERAVEVTAKSPAEVIYFGANFDAMVTNPTFFKEHILPFLKVNGAKLQAKGKYVLSHTDGENTGLLGLYLESGIDIADSICPAPMTKLSLRSIKDVLGSRITIMGGIPSICLLKDAVSDTDFEAFMESFFKSIGNGSRLIAGIADTTPPDADFKRIERIRDLIEEFGPVKL